MASSPTSTEPTSTEPTSTEPTSTAKLIAGQRILCTLGNLGPAFAKLPLAGLRRSYDAYDRLLGSGFRADVSTEDRQIPVGEHQLPIRVYHPIGAEPSLTMVYFHGGGYVIGGLKSHHGFCSLLASKAGINVIAVDYRRAPESKFPGPIEDGLGAWNWVVDHGAELGIKNTKLGVGGDSAGGNLAAVLSMQTFKGAISGQLSAVPAFQFLLYPWVDMCGEPDSIKRFGKGLLLTEETTIFFRDNYLQGSDEALVSASSPMACGDVAGTPDSLIVTVEYDVLRDEGLAFVEKLKVGGVNVIHQHLPDCTHGFISMGKFSGATRKRLQQICDMLAEYGSGV
ncbi:MAG: alpha/beta hydrolase [Porticoccaceae bacterium]|nr:alpha/beta hydrolase [Porticoccaceae bacterium]